MDLGRKVKHGIEEAPLVTPSFAPLPVTQPNPATQPVPAVPERELVPVRRG